MQLRNFPFLLTAPNSNQTSAFLIPLQLTQHSTVSGSKLPLALLTERFCGSSDMHALLLPQVNKYLSTGLD